VIWHCYISDLKINTVCELTRTRLGTVAFMLLHCSRIPTVRDRCILEVRLDTVTLMLARSHVDSGAFMMFHCSNQELSHPVTNTS
jgi:hypothetical protein